MNKTKNAKKVTNRITRPSFTYYNKSLLTGTSTLFIIKGFMIFKGECLSNLS